MFPDESLIYFRCSSLPSTDQLSELQSFLPERGTSSSSEGWTPRPQACLIMVAQATNCTKREHPQLCILLEWCLSSFQLRMWFEASSGLKLLPVLPRNRPRSHQKALVDLVVCSNLGNSTRTWHLLDFFDRLKFGVHCGPWLYHIS